MKLGHINDSSTRVGSGIADWLRKGLENNHQVEISNPKKAVVKFTAEETATKLRYQCSVQQI